MSLILILHMYFLSLNLDLAIIFNPLVRFRRLNIILIVLVSRFILTHEHDNFVTKKTVLYLGCENTVPPMKFLIVVFLLKSAFDS
jgi:hypothetical protein